MRYHNKIIFFKHFIKINMAKTKPTVAIIEEKIVDKIHLIRGQKIMIDRDLAELYGIETKRLKEQVNRNLSRFPKHYMFELTQKGI